MSLLLSFITKSKDLILQERSLYLTIFILSCTVKIVSIFSYFHMSIEDHRYLMILNFIFIIAEIFLKVFSNLYTFDLLQEKREKISKTLSKAILLSPRYFFYLTLYVTSSFLGIFLLIVPGCYLFITGYLTPLYSILSPHKKNYFRASHKITYKKIFIVLCMALTSFAINFIPFSTFLWSNQKIFMFNLQISLVFICTFLDIFLNITTCYFLKYFIVK